MKYTAYRGGLLSLSTVLNGALREEEKEEEGTNIRSILGIVIVVIVRYAYICIYNCIYIILYIYIYIIFIIYIYARTRVKYVYILVTNQYIHPTKIEDKPHEERNLLWCSFDQNRPNK